ncbi:WAP four-disulfide core domain protein 5 [Pteronotus mesoamericanus]|uniref:WAP four-disulfide core domain protein 5 n=1 Tax=Pteronotus mesoamericanus TaxID=1884717 RepID=UPI0023ECE74D|nr:WAP four-disulfide core domain protein 5 [Pteronotus parnellii mesoamericanus]
MSPQSHLLLVALLVLGSQLPAALGRRNGERRGGCPPDDEPCVLSVPDQCLGDSQCPSMMKCCYKNCFRQCVRMVAVKQGACPEDRLQCLSPIQHLCRRDSDCRGLSRCCLGACGRDCRSPVRGSVALNLRMAFPGGRDDEGAWDLPPRQQHLCQQQFQPSASLGERIPPWSHD